MINIHGFKIPGYEDEFSFILRTFVFIIKSIWMGLAIDSIIQFINVLYYLINEIYGMVDKNEFNNKK